MKGLKIMSLKPIKSSELAISQTPTKRYVKYSSIKKSSNNFTRDMDFEVKSSRYLEDFTSFHTDFGIVSTVNNKELQMKGIDYLASGDDGVQQMIDAKAIASSFGTFSFELEGNVRSRKLGWMLQDNETTHFAIIYHNFIHCEGYYKNKLKEFNNDTIRDTAVLLINKQKLKDEMQKWLDTSNYSSFEELNDIIRAEAARLDEIQKGEKTKYENLRLIFGEDGYLAPKPQTGIQTFTIVLTRSKAVPENPINLVINKRFLESISDKVIVYQNDTKKEA